RVRQQLVRRQGNAGLFMNFPDCRGFERLAGLDETTRWRPKTAVRRYSALDQQHLTLRKNDGQHQHRRPTGGRLGMRSVTARFTVCMQYRLADWRLIFEPRPAMAAENAPRDLSLHVCN